MTDYSSNRLDTVFAAPVSRATETPVGGMNGARAGLPGVAQ